jgi:hypothetical protein
MASRVGHGHLADSGVNTVATVTSLHQTGAFLNMAPVVQLDLVVLHGAPVRVRHQEAVPHVNLTLVQPGSTIRVKVDPADPRRLWIDWTKPALGEG